MKRLAALTTLLLLVIACESGGAGQPPKATPAPAPTAAPRTVTAAGVPVAGVPVAGLESYDRLIPEVMTKWQIPGGAVAVAKDGRLVFAHGYGWADVEAGEPVMPDSLFRIASISKPITAVSILKLHEAGLLDLDARVFDILSEFRPTDGRFADPRLADMTVRQLLYHAAGWDRDATFDPMFRSREIAAALGVPAPAGSRDIIRYMVTRPLDFDPGSKSVYSNFGYCILGRIIERVSGRTYEQFVKEELLEPLGIRRMAIGHTLAAERGEGEVRYYDPGGQSPPTSSVFGTSDARVPAPYGGLYLEAMDAHGGWIASAIDLVRFAVSVDGARAASLLTPASVSTMTARPPPPIADYQSDHYYAMGWEVRPIGNSANWWHSGRLPGTQSLLVRSHEGFVWAAVFNEGTLSEQSLGEIDAALWRAFQEVGTWPSHDLFDRPR